MNIRNVRFIWKALSIMVDVMWDVYTAVCSLWDSYPCSSWFSYDVCDIRVICNTILCTWFLYIEEFSILPCPTCPTYQSYISVGLSADTLVDTLPCFVSKISVCIRYDGWTAKYGVCETNMNNVRFHPYSDWCNMYCVAGSGVRWMQCTHNPVVFAPYVGCVFGIRVICIVIPWTWFLYIEEFLKLPCPTCPACQTYILVGLCDDTLSDTLACQVSKIELCVCYDGWAAYLSMWQMNMDYVRFCRVVTRTHVCICLLSVPIYPYGVLVECSDRIFYIAAVLLAVSSMSSTCMCYDGC